MSYQTGYFADENGRSKVHIVKDGEPDCGAQISANKTLQFCAARVVPEYLDCRACQRKAEALEREDLANG